MWKVKIEDQAAEDLSELIENGSITSDDLEVLRAWVKEIESGNYETHIQGSRYWNDHSLEEEWEGFRSSSFGFKGRIIYKIIDGKLIVYVVRITPDHDYRR